MSLDVGIPLLQHRTSWSRGGRPEEDGIGKAKQSLRQDVRLLAQVKLELRRELREVSHPPATPGETGEEEHQQ